MNKEIPIRIDNGDGRFKAKICIDNWLSKPLIKNDITVFWLDEWDTEIEQCYYNDLSEEQKRIVDKAIHETQSKS